MSDLPPDPALDDTDDAESNSTHAIPSPSSTSSVPSGGRSRRRPIADDDLPTGFARPVLSRRQDVQPQPPQDYYPPSQPARQPRNRRRQERPMRAPTSRAGSGLYLPWWSLVVMIAFVGCMAIGALFVVSTLESKNAPGGDTPVFIVITSTFTAGPPASPSPLPQRPTLTVTAPLPTIPPTLTLPPGNFAIGERVVVVGVGEAALNVRASPGTAGTVKFRSRDGEIFVLKDGPQFASNDEWWFIQDLSDTNKNGWASRRFLAVQSAVRTGTP